MRISIITVCYNSESYISSIGSVISQNYGQVEFIIIDGVSFDGTVSIVQSFGDKVSHFFSEPDKGIYDSMNKGLALATGDVIWILNSDDFYPSASITKGILSSVLYGHLFKLIRSSLLYREVFKHVTYNFFLKKTIKKNYFRPLVLIKPTSNSFE